MDCGVVTAARNAIAVHSRPGLVEPQNTIGSRFQTLAPPFHDQLNQLLRQELSHDERELIRTYRRLGKNKQAALRNLLS